MKFTPDTEVHPDSLSNFSRFTQSWVSAGGTATNLDREPGVNPFINGRDCASSDCEWDGEWDDCAR